MSRSTPLRRLSSSSLRSLSLSHSRTRPSSSLEPPLQHLVHLFSELSDAASDLAANFERLGDVAKELDGFNEAFGGYLYGLRTGCYLVDFQEAPTRFNFEKAKARVAQQQAAAPPRSLNSDSDSDDDGAQRPPGQGFDNTFHTHDSDFSMIKQEPTRGGLRGRGRGARGRGGAAATTRKQVLEGIKFADSVIQLLPIKFREQQPERKHTEQVIALLRANEGGLTVQGLSQQVTIPTHRINDILAALVRAKVALRELIPGGTAVFRLDPAKKLSV